MVTDLNDYFASSFIDNQIVQFSKTFYDKFYHWHLADLKKFIECCKGLNFGKPYGAVNVATLMEWANEYDRQRDEVIQQIINEEYQELKAKEKE